MAEGHSRHDPLKMLALDADDLGIVSAHLQDAIVKVADMAYVPREKRFAFVANRFDWETALVNAKMRRRRRAGVHIDRVMKVRALGVKPGEADRVLNLLAIEFSETDAPSGTVTLVFSGGAAIALDIECIEAGMADLGPEWQAEHCPTHLHLPKVPAYAPAAGRRPLSDEGEA